MNFNMKKKKDNRKTVEIFLSESEFNWIAKEAHERNITFNERANQILAESLKKLEEDPKFRDKFLKELKSKDKLEKAYDTCSRATPTIPGGVRTSKKETSKARVRGVASVSESVPKRKRTS